MVPSFIKEDIWCESYYISRTFLLFSMFLILPACLNADDIATYTVYPSVGNPNELQEPAQLGLDPLTTCASRLIWKRNRSRLRNRPLSRSISQTAAADGVFTVSRRRGREVEGWFEIWQVIVAGEDATYQGENGHSCSHTIWSTSHPPSSSFRLFCPLRLSP